MQPVLCHTTKEFWHSNVVNEKPRLNALAIEKSSVRRHQAHSRQHATGVAAVGLPQGEWSLSQSGTSHFIDIMAITLPFYGCVFLILP